MLNPKIIEALGLHKINVNSEIVIAKYKKSAIVKFSSPKFVKDFKKWRTISLAEATTAVVL